MAIAFVDMRDSTGMAGGLSPGAFAAALTQLREAVARSASRHGGMIDKFIGDGALVVFGALDARASAPRDAVAFAQDLLADLDELRPPFSVGVGLHWGDAFCGVITAGGRQEFTIVGDAVNQAAKVEKASRRHRARLVASRALLERAGEDLASWRALGREGAGELFADGPA